MATWQVQFHVCADGVTAGVWRWTRQRLILFYDALGEVLPRGESWSAAQILFGQVQGHCFEVWLADSGLPEEARLRLDARDGDIGEVAGRLLSVVSSFGLTLVEAESGELVATEAQFAITFRRSRAFRFVSDPAQYLLE